MISTAGRPKDECFAFPTGKGCGQKSLPDPKNPSYVIDVNLPKLT